MNAISLLRADHRALEELFSQLEKLKGKAKGKKALVAKITRELSIHTSIEERVFYPYVKERVADEKELILESLEEHGIAKWELYALESMDERDERFDAKCKVLMDVVRHHIDEEEQELFPRVRQVLGNAKLNELGGLLEKARKNAPTRPHPRAPDTPPANIVVGMGASMLARARRAGRTLLGAHPKAERAASNGKHAPKRTPASKQSHAKGRAHAKTSHARSAHAR